MPGRSDEDWTRQAIEVARSEGSDPASSPLGCVIDARHVDTLAFIADAYRSDIVVEGGCQGDECATLYYRPDAELPRDEQANL